MLEVRPGAIRLDDEAGTSITMRDFNDPFRDGYLFVDFMVDLTGPGLAASSSVRTIEGQIVGASGLSSFASQLADMWKGWAGPRTWESVEHDLEVLATHDGRGHVDLRFTLNESYRPDAWTAAVVLQVDAGEDLKAFVAAVERLLADALTSSS
jgi:hypothetical protein